MRSRSLLLLSLFVILVAACSKEKRFTVVGNFKNLPSQRVRLEELRVSDSITVLDSVTADKDGKFELGGEATEPGFYRLTFERGGYILLSLQSGTVHLNGDYQKLQYYTVTGSPASESLHGFMRNVGNYMGVLSKLDYQAQQLHAQGRDSAIA